MANAIDRRTAAKPIKFGTETDRQVTPATLERMRLLLNELRSVHVRSEGLS